MATPAAAPRPAAPAPMRSRFALARARHRSLLRRRTDRWRSTVVQLQLLAAVVAAALCALLGMSVYQHGRADALQLEQRLRPVQAKILGQPYASGVGSEMAQVGWTGADGERGQGVAAVQAAAEVGDSAGIWLDVNGRPTRAPASEQDTVGTAVLTGVLCVLCAWGLVIGAGTVARDRLDRHDEKAWEAAWQVYEPLWSHRR